MFNSDQKRAFTAVLLSGLVLFGWQYFFAPAPVENSSKTSTQQASEAPATTAATTSAPSAQLAQASPVTKPLEAASIAPASFTLRRGDYEFSINNDLSVKELKNPNSVFSFLSLSDSATPLRFQLVTQTGPIDLFFDLKQEGENKVSGSNASFGMSFSAFIQENGKVNFSFSSSQEYKYRLLFTSTPKTLDNGQIRHFTALTNEVKLIEVSDDVAEDGNLKWFGIDYNYHLFALILKDKLAAKYTATEKGQFFVELATPLKNFSGELLFTKKNYDTLLGLGDNLHLSVDFGFFAVLAVPLLRGLQYIHNYIPNYGIAIILLTILIRILTFPLQYKSFVSMKKMQLIQPELTRIKEKYKDEPQKMQKETMDLFKKAGANPLSGCLPLLLQMPFFFAIYKVLYSAVELVGAPFYGWIHDLSIHDPFYILPVLMGVAMFVQQKITPQTSMDPTQQKIMLLMPIIFAFIMKSLPAGLVLYILVSTVVGIAQQFIVYKMAD